jgi:hypothetical protein
MIARPTLPRFLPLSFCLVVSACADGQIAPADIGPADTAENEVGDGGDTADADSVLPDTTEPADWTSFDSGPDSDDTEDAEDTGDIGDISDIEISDADTSDTTADDVSISETSDADDADGADAEVPVRCPDGLMPGDRFAKGDHCNACECGESGAATCTKRECRNDKPSCDYGAVTYAYGERFAADDRCNECVCAASGLACTRRCSGLPEEGAILVEDLDAPCGETLSFTARSVLDELPSDDIIGPFVYNRSGALYPETRPDTSGRLRIQYEGGFIVCRLPMIEQPAFDIEVSLEWLTGDGAFDEGVHTYLRKNGFGFVDAWYVVGSWPHGALDGEYDSTCLDPSGYSLSGQIDRDGTTAVSVFKTCETDIGLEVGTLQTDVTP